MNKTKANRIILYITAVAVIAFGFFVAFLVHNLELRRVTDVTATVRLADGTSEDEIAIVTTKISKIVQPNFILFNRTDYYVSSVRLPEDGAAIEFPTCDLQGVYNPVKCSDTNGASYWVTLTEIQ